MIFHDVLFPGTAVLINMKSLAKKKRLTQNYIIFYFIHFGPSFFSLAGVQPCLQWIINTNK